MSWPCRMISLTPEVTCNTLKIGDMFFYDKNIHKDIDIDPEDPDADHEPYYWINFHAEDRKLSEYYKQNNSHRKPLLVWMPDKILFCVDSMCWKDGVYYGGWAVTGEAPNITVHPSIDIKGAYHGYLTNGIIGDDVEGRTYDPVTQHQIRPP